MSNISLDNKIFKSRTIILQQLKSRGYDIDDYNNFSLNEIHILNKNNQLDMILYNKDENKKTYIKYHLNGKLTKTNIYDYIEDLYDVMINDGDSLENDEDSIEGLVDDDDLIIIIKDKMNDTLKSFVSNLYFKDKKFINVYNINRYLYNILDHSMVPPHISVSNNERLILEKKLNIINPQQWPEISRFDPVAQAIGLRPNQLCKILRKSQTSSISIYYRLCLQNIIK